MNGSRLLEGYVPEFDATVVTRVLDAGGRIAGKAACEDLCLSAGSHTCASGPIRNPHEPSRSAGGSSGGSAVLVATGAVDYALAGDQGGIFPGEWFQPGAAPQLFMHGTADADALKSARLEIGEGETPASWKPVAEVKKAAGPAGVLGDIPAGALKGAKVWQIRIVVEHKDGSVREARFKLTVG